MRGGPGECRADDAGDAGRGIDFLGDELVAGDTSPAEVDAFGILAEDDEVDRPGRPQRGQVGVQQLHRAEIDVQIEPEPKPQQDVARVLVAGNARVAESAEPNRVHVVAQVGERVVGQGLARLEIVIGGVRQALEGEGEAVPGRRPLERRDGGVDHLGANAVARDDGDAITRHSKPVARPQPMQ